MATLADIRRTALKLPDVSEVEVYGGPMFKTGKKTFICFWGKPKRWMFKLPHARQDILFEVRPDVFEKYQAGAMIWSYVEIGALSRAECAELVIESWKMAAPKKDVRAYEASAPKKRSTSA